MPTRKQRRRDAKAKRHEYEYVVVDEDGNEVPVDPAELRAAKEKERPAAERTKTPARDARGRPLREPRKPSWRRAIRTGLLFVVALVLFTSLVGKNRPSPLAEAVQAVVFGGISIPFFYWMDRLTYRRWERMVGRAPEPKAKKS